jgi:SsrA-binding protein
MSRPSQRQSSPAEPGLKVVAQNRQANFRYHILERYEAGIVLTGTEVKSLRAGGINLRDAYAVVRGGEAWLEKCHISPYPNAGYAQHDPLRTRKLLLRRAELHKLAGRVQEKGLTLVPLRVYFKNGRAKCELGLARGKKVYDRRAEARRRILDREVEAELHRYR